MTVNSTHVDTAAAGERRRRARSPEPSTARISENIKALRTLRGWSAERLARELLLTGCDLGLTRSVIVNLERGRREVVTVDELLAFAAVFNVEAFSLTRADPACLSCGNMPPIGYSCLACGRVATGPAQPC